MSPIVYSTDVGRIKPSTIDQDILEKGDGIVRIQRQTSGRKGKGVCVITGLCLPASELLSLTAEIKKRCGCGGTIKNNAIEIQGDKKEQIKSLLECKGFKVKFSGG